MTRHRGRSFANQSRSRRSRHKMLSHLVSSIAAALRIWLQTNPAERTACHIDQNTSLEVIRVGNSWSRGLCVLPPLSQLPGHCSEVSQVQYIAHTRFAANPSKVSYMLPRKNRHSGAGKPHHDLDLSSNRHSSPRSPVQICRMGVLSLSTRQNPQRTLHLAHLIQMDRTAC